MQWLEEQEFQDGIDKVMDAIRRTEPKRRVSGGRGVQRVGEHGENIARAELQKLGVLAIQEIATPISKVPAGNNTYRVYYKNKVYGDHYGVLPGGRSVLAETKTVDNKNLTWTDFHGEHQPQGLLEHASTGALSLLIWVHHSGVYVMEFPVEGFRPGKGITLERARELDRITRAKIRLEVDKNQKRLSRDR